MKFLADFFPVLLFFAAYQLYDIYVATAVAIAAAFIQVLFNLIRYRKVQTMHWVTLGLLVIFGGMTLLLHDPVFIKWKPTVVNWLFGTAIMGSAFLMQRSLIQRMMDHAITLPGPIWFRLSLAWGLFFIAMGILNLYVAFNFTEEIWVNFKLFGMMGLTFVFALAQGVYLTRHMQQVEITKE